MAPVNLDLKALIEPATKLIDAVDKAIGTLYEPTRIRKEAKAKADAAIILARGEIQKEALIRRAVHRFAFVEARRQQNIEDIVKQARAALPETVSPDPVSTDWMVQFFDNCKDVSESEMQALWAKILAGEVTRPPSCSRRTLEALKLMDREDAQIFTDCCSLSLKAPNDAHGCFEITLEKALRSKYGIADARGHLVSIGLLAADARFHGVSTFNESALDYFGQHIKFTAPPKPPGALLEQTVIIRGFSGTGEELSKVVSARPVSGFIEQLSRDLAPLGIGLIQGGN